jgi:hypothetical protein
MMPDHPAPPTPAGRGGGIRVACLVVAVFGLSFVSALAAFLAGGRSPPAPETPRDGAAEVRPAGPDDRDPRLVRDFTGRLDRDVRQGLIASETVSIRYDGGEELRTCDVVVEVWYEDGHHAQVDRLWAVWSRGQTREIAFPWRGSLIESFHLLGTAAAGSGRVRIETMWEVEK